MHASVCKKDAMTSTMTVRPTPPPSGGEPGEGPSAERGLRAFPFTHLANSPLPPQRFSSILKRHLDRGLFFV